MLNEVGEIKSAAAEAAAVAKSVAIAIVVPCGRLRLPRILLEEIILIMMMPCGLGSIRRERLREKQNCETKKRTHNNAPRF